MADAIAPVQNKSTPSWVWPVAIAGGGVLFLMWFFGGKDPKAGDSAQINNAADQKLNELGNSGIQPTISNADAENLSAVIVEATDDCGTDEEAIYDAFAQLHNEADLWRLVKVFNVRMIHSCFGGNYFGNTPYNLPQIITEELSSSERGTLNSILAQKGITYRF